MSGHPVASNGGSPGADDTAEIALRRAPCNGAGRGSAFLHESDIPRSTSENGSPGVWLNSTLAHELRVKLGDRIGLRLQKPTDVPRESLLGQRKSEELVNEQVFTVAKVLTEDDPLDPFSLRPAWSATHGVRPAWMCCKKG